MDNAMGGHCGSSSLGIVPSTFMIENTRLRTSTFSLRHRVVGDFVCRWVLYTPPFKPSPTDRGCMRGIGEGGRCLSTTFPTQKIRIVLNRTEDLKNVLSLLHSVVWRRCECRGFAIRYVHVLRPWSSSHNPSSGLLRSHSNISLSYSFEIGCTIEFQATYASLARRRAVISFFGCITDEM